MNVDLTYHFPQDLMELLIDTVPLLCRSKVGVLQFLRGAGVPSDMLVDLTGRVQQKDGISKYEIVRTTLGRLNEKGEERTALRARREIVKRVVEWEDFSTCWPDDLLKAKGLIGEVRRLVDVVDSFKRMNLEREAERTQRQAIKDKELGEIQRRQAELATIKEDFYRLFSETDPQRRGKALEGVLNRLFEHAGILIREAFTVAGVDGVKVAEQIDGLVEIDAILYLVEMKWWSEPIGAPELQKLIAKSILRGRNVRCIFVSYSGYAATAVSTARDALGPGIPVILCDLRHFVQLIEAGGDLKGFFKDRFTALIADKNPYLQ